MSSIRYWGVEPKWGTLIQMFEGLPSHVVAMYLGGPEAGPHEAIIVQAPYDGRMGVQPGDTLHIDLTDWKYAEDT